MECEEAVYSNEYFDFISESFSGTGSDISGYCVQKINEVYEVVFARREGLLPLSISNYSYASIPKCFTLMDRSALENSGILRMHNYPTLSLKGQGVMIGFVDTGIDYKNPVFRNSDGSSRIAAIWDQTDRSGTAPEGFLYGSEYRREVINQALESQRPETVVPSKDTNGHGTFLASVAAGSENLQQDFSGAAPYAQIAMVKLKEAKEYLREFYFIPEEAAAYQENDIMAGVAYLDQLAKSLNMPLVLCISVGTNSGSHGSGGSPLVSLLNSVALRRPRAVVTAAGNEGNKRHHFAGELGDEEDYRNVEINVGEGVAGFQVEMWAGAPQLFVVEIISPTGERIPKEFILSGGKEYTFLFENTTVSVDYRIARIFGGDQLIFMRFSRPVKGIWNIRVYRQSVYAKAFHMWLPMRELMTGEVYFLRSNPDTTIVTPGAAYNPMTVTAYEVRDNSLFVDAGRGYTVTGRVKPDFAAPGVNVYGAGLRNQFVTQSGTSVAAAVAGGAAALLLEWAVVRGNYTLISSTDIKNILIRGAARDPGRTYPNREWGYGRLDLYQAFENFRIR